MKQSTDNGSNGRPEHAYVLFDGVCNLCNGSVNFIIDRDPNGYFLFAPLQSVEARDLIGRDVSAGSSLDSIVLLEAGRLYHRSTAALRISRRLNGLWPLLYGFMVIPRFIRDTVYNWIAKNRYRWFGKSDQCRIPTPELKSRFLVYESMSPVE